MCGPRQHFFFQCGSEMPKVWAPLKLLRYEQPWGKWRKLKIQLEIKEAQLSQKTLRLLRQCFKAILHLVCFWKISKLITWKDEWTKSKKNYPQQTDIRHFQHKTNKEKEWSKLNTLHFFYMKWKIFRKYRLSFLVVIKKKKKTVMKDVATTCICLPNIFSPTPSCVVG